MSPFIIAGAFDAKHFNITMIRYKFESLVSNLIEGLILYVIYPKDIGISTLHRSLQQSIDIISRVEGVAWSLEEALYDCRMPCVRSHGGRMMDPCWNVAPKSIHVLSTIYFPWIHAGTMITLTTPNERLERICIASRRIYLLSSLDSTYSFEISVCISSLVS